MCCVSGTNFDVCLIFNLTMFSVGNDDAKEIVCASCNKHKNFLQVYILDHVFVGPFWHGWMFGMFGNIWNLDVAIFLGIQQCTL